MRTTRRDFIHLTAGLSVLALWPARVRSQGTPVRPHETPSPRTFEISLAEWSYHQALQQGRMQHADFAKVAKDVHGLAAVEYVNTLFKDKSAGAEYVKELKQRADDVGVRILLVMCDGEGDLGHADKEQRAQAVANHVKWLEAARALGCHSIRVNASGSGTPEAHAAQAADGLHALCLRADPLGLNVIVENHGGHSSNGAWLAGVVAKADHPRAGTLPDFGNFQLGDHKSYDRYLGVTELMPRAKAVSAKSYDFDEQGQETTIDYTRMLGIVLAAGYNGHVGIEYEGSRLSEKDGIEATKRLLERVRGALR